MKTIIYLLIAVFIFGIIVSGRTIWPKPGNSILIQSVDNGITSVSLSRSAEIISSRLKEFGTVKFELTVIPAENKIRVEFTGQADMKLLESLMIQKGHLAFYETYDRKSLSALVEGGNKLYGMLNGSDAHNQAIIGCVTPNEIEKVNDFLDSAGFSGKCRFAWSQPSENHEMCLYALKSGNEGGTILTGTDVEYIHYSEDGAAGNYGFEISFNKSAVETWSDITRRNLNHPIAIVLDDNVIYDPLLRSAVENGKCSIGGRFTLTEVRYFAALGNNGELPVSFRIVE